LDPVVNRRRTKIVDKGFQFGIALRLLLVLTAMLVAGIALAFAPSFYILATTDDLKSLEPASIEFLMLHKRLWPAMLFPFAAIFFYSLYFSHRIAGPMHRFNSVLRALLEGRKPEVLKLREGDCFQETAELLGRLADKIGTSDEGSRQHHSDTPPHEGPE